MPRPSDTLRAFLSEFRRRRVGRVAVAYAVGAWALVEVADTVFPRLMLSDDAVTLVIIVAFAGFPVALVLAWWYDITPDPSDPPSRRAKLGTVALLLALLVLAGVATSSAWDVLARPDRIRSLVVLPFEDRTGDPDQQYLVAGIYDGLLGELAQLADLRIISRTSARSYRNSDKSIPDIARELSVDAVVEGSVERTGDEVTVRLRLVRAAPVEESVWAEAYSRDVRDVVAMYGDIARAIADGIESRISPSQESRFASAPAIDPRVYELYLRGTYHLNRLTPADVEAGLEYLHAAVDLDPANARVYAGLAEGYASIGHGFVSSADAWERARAAATRATTLDPALAEGHAALADVKLYYEWDWSGAEAAFLRADELNPNLALNHYHYAWFLALFDRFDEAIVEHRRAQSLDPLRPLHTAWLAQLHNLAGDYDEAIRQAEIALDLAPNHPAALISLGISYLQKGMPERAMEFHEQLASTPARWVLGATCARTGRLADARRIAAEVEAEGPTAFGSLGLVAIYAELGELDTAFRWLEHQPAHAFVPWVRNEMFFEGLREDPRFTAWLERMDLPAVEPRRRAAR